MQAGGAGIFADGIRGAAFGDGLCGLRGAAGTGGLADGADDGDGGGSGGGLRLLHPEIGAAHFYRREISPSADGDEGRRPKGFTLGNPVVVLFYVFARILES